MPKSNSKEAKESSILNIDKILNKIEAGAVSFKNTLSSFWESIMDFFQNLYESLIEPLIPAQIKDWVKKNLFSTEKSKENTKNINDIYNKLKWKEKPDFFPFYLAMQWYNNQKGQIKNSKYLTVIDYSKPVTQNRLYVINMNTLTVEDCVPTWHWKGSGNTQKTDKFSNTPNSNQTSIGFLELQTNQLLILKEHGNDCF